MAAVKTWTRKWVLTHKTYASECNTIYIYLCMYVCFCSFQGTAAVIFLTHLRKWVWVWVPQRRRRRKRPTPSVQKKERRRWTGTRNTRYLAIFKSLKTPKYTLADARNSMCCNDWTPWTAFDAKPIFVKKKKKRKKTLNKKLKNSPKRDNMSYATSLNDTYQQFNKRKSKTVCEELIRCCVHLHYFVFIINIIH